MSLEVPQTHIRTDLPPPITHSEAFKFVDYCNKETGITIINGKTLDSADCPPDFIEEKKLVIGLIEETWRFYTNWRRSNEGFLFIPSEDPEEGIACLPATKSSFSDVRRYIEQGESPSTVGTKIRDVAVTTSLIASTEWLISICNSLTNNNSTEQKSLYFQIERFMSLNQNQPLLDKFYETVREPFPFHEHPFPTRAGLGTAIQTFWNIASVIPAVFQRETGKAPSDEEVLQIGKSIPKVALPLMKFPTSTFNKLKKQMTPGGDLCFKPEYFRLKKSPKNGWEIYFSEKLLKEKPYEPEEHLGQFSIGCPALHAQGIKKKSILPEFFDWQMNILKTFYIPGIQRFLQQRKHTPRQ